MKHRPIAGLAAAAALLLAAGCATESPQRGSYPQRGIYGQRSPVDTANRELSGFERLLNTTLRISRNLME